MEEVDRSQSSDDDLKIFGRSLQAAAFTIAVHPQEQEPTYLLIESRHEKVSPQQDPHLMSPGLSWSRTIVLDRFTISSVPTVY